MDDDRRSIELARWREAQEGLDRARERAELYQDVIDGRISAAEYMRRSRVLDLWAAHSAHADALLALWCDELATRQ